jgi:hypothetical protein
VFDVLDMARGSVWRRRSGSGGGGGVVFVEFSVLCSKAESRTIHDPASKHRVGMRPESHTIHDPASKHRVGMRRSRNKVIGRMHVQRVHPCCYNQL